MRPFVAGTTVAGSLPGLQILNFWMRFPITVPARQAYYKALQQNAAPSAPGAYTAADAQELSDFKNGLFIERVGFDVLDTTQGQSVTDRLTRLYALAQAAIGAADTATLQYYGSYYDPNTSSWVVESA